MTTTRFLIIFALIIFASCNSKEKALKIYHLKPNSIGELTEYKKNKKYYELDRDDFFAIKNFDATNDNHKVKVDSFVINYIKNDNYLIKNKNARWSLIFFKYGDGITESTKHQFDTDYTIHNLFAFEKRQIYYAFSSRKEDKKYKYTGYYFKRGDSITNEKRKIIVDYFKNKSH